jgi:thiol-disulfide isomerase/thioredoxin
MKIFSQFLIASLLITLAKAEFRVWTRADGKSAELDLVSVSGTEVEKVGEFKMRNGKSVSIAASTLAEADAKLLKDWKAAEATSSPSSTATGTAFDKILEGNLVKLSGKSLKSSKEPVKPEKYFLFYYTASWCGPCHKFTPSLVEFYNKNKDASFELVLITSDEDEGAMEEYAAEMKMPWPQLKLSKAEKFKEEFKHPGSGIPNLVLTDLQGTLIKGSYEGKNYVGPQVVMNHLATLLNK